MPHDPHNQFIFVIKLQIFIVYQGCPRNACTFAKAPMSAPDYGGASAHNFGMPQLTANHLPQKKVSLLCLALANLNNQSEWYENSFKSCENIIHFLAKIGIILVPYLDEYCTGTTNNQKRKYEDLHKQSKYMTLIILNPII